MASAFIQNFISGRRCKRDRMDVSICAGFGSEKDGEDRFDTILGLLGMLRFFTGMDQLPEPSSPTLTQIEGWILGLACQ